MAICVALGEIMRGGADHAGGYRSSRDGTCSTVASLWRTGAARGRIRLCLGRDHGGGSRHGRNISFVGREFVATKRQKIEIQSGSVAQLRRSGGDPAKLTRGRHSPISSARWSTSNSRDTPDV